MLEKNHKNTTKKSNKVRAKKHKHTLYLIVDQGNADFQNAQIFLMLLVSFIQLTVPENMSGMSRFGESQQ